MTPSQTLARSGLPLVAICCVGMASVAYGGPCIAELVERENIRQAISPETVDDFVWAVEATPEQASLARVLVEGARTELARVINRHLRQSRAGCTLEELLASEANVVTGARKIEEQLLSDLRSLLTQTQAGQFEKFERARRRVLIPSEDWGPLSFDVIKLLRKAGVDAAADPELSAALQRFDIEGDKALVARLEAKREYFKVVREPYDGSPESQARQNGARRRWESTQQEHLRLQAQILQIILPRLSEQLQNQIVRASLPEKRLGFFGSAINPDQRPIVREVRRLKLTPAQQERVNTLVTEAEREVLALARKYIQENAAYVLGSEEFRQKQRTTPANAFLGDISTIEKKLDTEVLAVLTVQQRGDYDASPVIEPTTTSPINDEPTTP